MYIVPIAKFTLTSATKFYAASYTSEPSSVTKNQSLKTLCTNISKTPIKPKEMEILLAMIFKILIQEHEEFEGTEFDDAEWEAIKDPLTLKKAYPTIRYTKLWMHFVTYCMITKPHSDFTEPERKQMLADFANKIAMQTFETKANGVTKKVFVCYGPGQDALKKTCSKSTTFKNAWNCILHLGHKHGILYVFLSI